MLHANPIACSEFGQTPTALEFFNEHNIDEIASRYPLGRDYLHELRVVASVLPFRVNSHVVDNLIDWSRVPDDPVFKIVFPRREMLPAFAFEVMSNLVRRGATKSELHAAAQWIRGHLNPHPAGQLELNRPRTETNDVINGLQHKYRRTLLFFPSEGQTCHSFCSFCFRWAQFVGDQSLKLQMSDRNVLIDYVDAHRELTDILVTGGDPMIMKAAAIERHVQAFLTPEMDHIRNIRFGTKALTFWPFRFTTAPDAEQVLNCFRQLVRAGKHVAIMAHVNHWQEIDNPYAREAIARIQDTGAVIRTQTPFLRGINDDADVCATMWTRQVELGIIPYYMFVARDTGAKSCFDVPLAHAFSVFKTAFAAVSGLARTVRGPSMSTVRGKIEVNNVVSINGKKYFALRYLQARDAADDYSMFFAEYCEKATWIDELKIVDLSGDAPRGQDSMALSFGGSW